MGSIAVLHRLGGCTNRCKHFIGNRNRLLIARASVFHDDHERIWRFRIL